MERMFSHSSINTFKQCPMLFKYKYIDKLIPLADDNKNLSIGKAFHYGIEKQSSEEALKMMDSDEFFMTEENETNKVIVMAMVDAFLEKYPESKTWIHEQTMTYKLLDESTEDDFVLIIDGLEEHEDGYYIIELKTASTINDSYVKKLDFIDQPNRYYYVAERVLGKPILGIKYYVVKKPMLRQKKDETVEQFRARLVERIKEDDSTMKFELFRTKEQIEDCIEDTKYDMRMINATTRYTKNLCNCSLYGTCPYIDLCRGVDNADLLFTRKDDVNVTREQESE